MNEAYAFVVLLLIGGIAVVGATLLAIGGHMAIQTFQERLCRLAPGTHGDEVSNSPRTSPNPSVTTRPITGLARTSDRPRQLPRI